MVNAYVCLHCGWKYEWTMGDRIKAVKGHELTHLLKKNGWTAAARNVRKSLAEERQKFNHDLMNYVQQHLQDRPRL